nr:hypothetical protein 22 [bacterium]
MKITKKRAKFRVFPKIVTGWLIFGDGIFLGRTHKDVWPGDPLKYHWTSIYGYDTPHCGSTETLKESIEGLVWAYKEG